MGFRVDRRIKPRDGGPVKSLRMGVFSIDGWEAAGYARPRAISISRRIYYAPPQRFRGGSAADPKKSVRFTRPALEAAALDFGAPPYFSWN